MPDPAFSVIIPCYNLGRYIDEAVQSALEQTFEDIEIVIVNDGSTDGFTNDLLANYRRPKTRVITTPNRGVMAARNLAIEATTGKYISALDADDILEPTYFEKAFRVLEADDSITWVSSWLRMFGDEDWEWKPERCDLVTLLGEQTVCTPAPVRRSAVRAIGGYDERMPKMGLEDWEFWINMAVHGYNGVILPEVLFRYRARADSLSKKAWFGEWHLELFRFMLEKHRAAYQAHLIELLDQREGRCCEVLATSYRIERHLDAWLEPMVARKEAELARLESRLPTPAPEAAPAPEPAPARPAAPAPLWRPWRIVTPLRFAYRVLKRVRAGGSETP
jgi:glycosyltransferase involved in cell wall biosynthesis